MNVPGSNIVGKSNLKSKKLHDCKVNDIPKHSVTTTVLIVRLPLFRLRWTKIREYDLFYNQATFAFQIGELEEVLSYRSHYR